MASSVQYCSVQYSYLPYIHEREQHTARMRLTNHDKPEARHACTHSMDPVRHDAAARRNLLAGRCTDGLGDWRGFGQGPGSAA